MVEQGRKIPRRIWIAAGVVVAIASVMVISHPFRAINASDKAAKKDLVAATKQDFPWLRVQSVRHTSWWSPSAEPSAVVTYKKCAYFFDIKKIDGKWTLAKNSYRLVPSNSKSDCPSRPLEKPN